MNKLAAAEGTGNLPGAATTASLVGLRLAFGEGASPPVQPLQVANGANGGGQAVLAS